MYDSRSLMAEIVKINSGIGAKFYEICR